MRKWTTGLAFLLSGKMSSSKKKSTCTSVSMVSTTASVPGSWLLPVLRKQLKGSSNKWALNRPDGKEA